MKFNGANFPVLKTERLNLRALKTEDASSILVLRSCEEINQFVATRRMQNLEEAKDFIQTCTALYEKGNRIFWVITKEQEVLGTIVLHRISWELKYAEIGYKLKPEMQQKGFMSEAISAVLKFGFKELNLETIEAFTHKKNKRSIALLEKYDFILQPDRKDTGFVHNQIFKLKMK